MPSNWVSNVQNIQDGELVDAAVASRPDRQIAGNVQYLRDILDLVLTGQATILPNATIAAGIMIGQPVFFNTVTQRFELAKADYTSDPISGTIALTAASDCLGLCYYKHNSTLADIIVGGCAPLDLTAAVGGQPAPGRYFLSTSVPGGLVRQSPPISLPVCFLDTNSRVYVNPLTRNFLTDHVHYQFSLVCAPAGTTSPPSNGAVHVISAPDPTQAGWLPANHAVFGNMAPVGAAWGYNIVKHPQLNAVWPPIPLEAVALFWDRGVDYTGGTMVPLGLNGGMAVIGPTTIWWMSNCHGEVPWPTTYDSASPPAPLDPDTAPPTCPPPLAMRLRMGYAVNVFATSSSVVTRLTSGNSLLTITDSYGHPATTGALTATVNMDLAVAPGSVTGSQVLKSFASNTFSTGYVLEGVRLSGAGLVASATQVDNTNPSNPIYQGILTLGVATASGAIELEPEVVRMMDVEEDVYNQLPFYRFPTGKSSAMYLRLAVPTLGLAGSPTCSLRVQAFGTASGTLPALTVRYRRYARPATNTPTSLSASDTALTVTTGQTLTPYTAWELNSGTFAVAAGDIVLITIQRNASDGYTGDVGLLRPAGIMGGT